MGVNAIYQVAPICQFSHLCFPPHTLFPVLSSLPSTKYQPIHFQMSGVFFLIDILSHDIIFVSPNFKLFILYWGIADQASLVGQQ